MSIQNNYVAIMAGGIGSRFWPESRTSYPKQFLDLLGTGRSLIQWTYDRFKHICPKENIYFNTNEQYITTLKSQIPEISDQTMGQFEVARDHKLFCQTEHLRIEACRCE